MTKRLSVALSACLLFVLSSCSKADDNAAAIPSAMASTEPMSNEGDYIIRNETGKEITGLYLYQTGVDDQGFNYAEETMGKGEEKHITLFFDEETASQENFALTVAYVADDTTVIVLDHLHPGNATLILKPAADIESGATPFSAIE